MFFKDYLTLKLKRIPKNNKIYEEFKQWRLFNKDFIEPELLLKDIYKNAKIYTNFLFLREKDDKLNFFFKQFVELNNTPSFVLLLKVLNDAENKLIDYQTLINILEICISFLVRRKICSIPSSSLNKIFEDLIQKIEDENYEQSINNFLINGKDSREFPDDNKFKQSFIENNFKQKQLPWFILKNIEKFFNKTPINLDLLSLEHILPQNRNLNKEWREVLGSEWKSKQENYLYKIGNLTLTSYNSEMSDKSFDEKKNMKNGFSDSGLRINDSLLNLSKWTEQEIDDRSTWLFNKAIKIWKYPDQQEDIIENSNNNQDNSNILDRYIKTEKTETLYHIINNWFLDQPYEIKSTYNKWYITYKLYYIE
ncbi:HNH endonuclease family protein [Mycoplasmopsis felis]|uniref:HNH endonuclease family protein n=1 Tax=Mycoplasmopsis felis TaxID=33923 RepID=UPI0021DF8613|nr:HNH endonuclease family protein [Mycoplasmopsis felis]MCU9940210.1 HNH endonuclease family protein [Mycoplasmopsis felis]